jgi:hypothetical protein
VSVADRHFADDGHALRLADLFHPEECRPDAGPARLRRCEAMLRRRRRIWIGAINERVVEAQRRRSGTRPIRLCFVARPDMIDARPAIAQHADLARAASRLSLASSTSVLSIS